MVPPNGVLHNKLATKIKNQKQPSSQVSANNELPKHFTRSHSYALRSFSILWCFQQKFSLMLQTILPFEHVPRWLWLSGEQDDIDLTFSTFTKQDLPRDEITKHQPSSSNELRAAHIPRSSLSPIQFGYSGESRRNHRDRRRYSGLQKIRGECRDWW